MAIFKGNLNCHRNIKLKIYAHVLNQSSYISWDFFCNVIQYHFTVNVHVMMNG